MVAMGLLNEQPHKLEEYVLLKFEMKTFEKRFARANALTEKLELQSMWEKYCAMEPVYEKVGDESSEEAVASFLRFFFKRKSAIFFPPHQVAPRCGFVF